MRSADDENDEGGLWGLGLSVAIAYEVVDGVTPFAGLAYLILPSQDIGRNVDLSGSGTGVNVGILVAGDVF